MKNKFSMLLASTVLMSSLAGASALALGNGFERSHTGEQSTFKASDKSERFMKHKFKKMAKYLELTTEQRQQAKTIHQEAKAGRLALKDSLKDFRQQTKLLVMASSFDEQAFLNLQSQYQDSFAQLALIKVKTKYRFMQILTEEQKGKMNSHQAERKQGRHTSE